MADRELRRMHRAELIEIIYALKQSEDQLKAQNAALTAQLQDRQLRLESAGSIAQAALELNNVFAAAQAPPMTICTRCRPVLRTPTPPPPIPFRRRAARPSAFWSRHRQTPTA